MSVFSQRILGGGSAFGELARGAPRPGFSASAMTALVLDQLAFGDSEAGTPETPLQTALRSGSATTLAGALTDLTAAQQTRLRVRVSAASLQELTALSRESDPELFAEGLLQWAHREEAGDRFDSAGVVYGLFAQTAPDGAPLLAGSTAGLRRRAAAGLDALLGRGAFGNRVEFLGRRFAREASDPVMLIGMGVGSAVFATARTAFLSRLLASPVQNLATVGWGARALAATGAFFLEVPAFWATSKGLREAITPGEQRWDLNNNLRELAGLGLTLGAMKLCGAAATGVSGRFVRTANAMEWTAAERLGQGLFQQGGMLGGILLGHRLEAAAGLRRDLDGATTLLDSLALLLQFHVGGRLSGPMLGERFQNYTRDLELRSQLLARRSERNFTGPGEILGPWGHPALATAAGGLAATRLFGEPAGSRAQELAMHMSGDSSLGGPKPSPSAARERGIRGDVNAELPLRSGRTADDRFETPLSPQAMLEALRGRPIFQELAGLLEFPEADWNRLDEKEFGAALGDALQQRLVSISRHPNFAALRLLVEGDLLETDFRNVPRFEEIPAELRESLDAVAELMQVAQFTLRTGQSQILEQVRLGVAPEQQVIYQELLSLLRLLKGPRLQMPSGEIARGAEVLGPDIAVLSHGTGDMSSLLKVIMHQVRPGGRPWYARYFATDADARIVDGIRRNGRNPIFPETKRVHHNYEGDLPIEAVHNKDPLANLLFRTVRVQLLNVPSFVLDRLMNEDFVRHLPENAILVSAIGGLLDTGAGRPKLPFQFFRDRLVQYGRDDVEIVSMAGYIPGDKMWRGEHVEVNLSTREDKEPRLGYPKEAASIAASLFTGQEGPTFSSDAMTATISHWDRSNNLGKVAKNVFTLMMGYRAAQIARQVAEQQREFSPDSSRYQEIQELGQARYFRARQNIWEMMQGLLVHNEGIKPSRARYTSAVETDFNSCSIVEFDHLIDVVRAAWGFPVRESSPEQVKEFLNKHVFSPTRHVASTRNPRRGIAQALYEIWSEQGLPYGYEEVGPKVTTEGVDSLAAMIRFYADSGNDIERRRLPDDIYELYQAFQGKDVERPPMVRPYLANALEREPESVETQELQETLRQVGIQPQRLRQLLEGRNEAALTLLNREIHRLTLKALELRRGREKGIGDLSMLEADLKRQAEVVEGMKEAMTRGNPVRILRSPLPIGPYQNAFVISRTSPTNAELTHQAFLRLDLNEVKSRLTSLGMFLRTFADDENVEIDVRIPDASQNLENFQRLFEVEMAGRTIVRTFQQNRSGAIRLSIDRRSLEQEVVERLSPAENFYNSLQPLARWVLGRSPEEEDIRQLLREPRHESSKTLDGLVRSTTGWVMLLGPSAGPIQAGVRAMLTRPEKSVLMGIYSGNELVDTFAVYRHDATHARVLSHQVLKKLSNAFPDSMVYGDLNALHYFNGFPVEEFIEDYQRYAAGQGIAVTQVRPIPLRDVPLEQALVGNIPGINAAVLKLFLMQEPHPERDQMLREVEPLYELPPDVARPRFLAIAQPYLERFEADYGAAIRGHQLFRLFQRFGFLRRSR